MMGLFSMGNNPTVSGLVSVAVALQQVSRI